MLMTFELWSQLHIDDLQRSPKFLRIRNNAHVGLITLPIQGNVLGNYENNFMTLEAEGITIL